MTRYILLVLNPLIALAIAPLFEGMIRRLTAKVQSRQGPPILQPYFDLFKLLIKEDLQSEPSGWSRIAPVLSLGAVLTVATLLPIGGAIAPLSAQGDILAIIYLLTFFGTAILLGGLSTRSPFAGIGASREMVSMVLLEPILAMALIVGAVSTHTLRVEAVLTGGLYSKAVVAGIVSLVAYLLALQAFVARQPFDVAEAEVEIMEGPFVEYSGPSYALFKYTMMVKQFLYTSLFVSLFLPWGSEAIYPAGLIIHLAKVATVVLGIGLVGCTNARLRIDQAMKYYATLGLVALVAMGLAIYGI